MEHLFCFLECCVHGLVSLYWTLMDRIKAPIKKSKKIRLYCRQLIFYIYNFLRHLFVNNADRLEDITRNVVLHVERFLLSCIKRFCSSDRVFISRNFKYFSWPLNLLKHSFTQKTGKHGNISENVYLTNQRKVRCP